MFNKRDQLIRIIRQNVPRPILQYAFLPNEVGFNIVGRTLDYCISSTVIDNWVLPDINLAGGQEVEIDLYKCIMREKEGGTIIEIPLALTAHRSITSVMSAGWSLSAAFLPGSGNEISSALTGPLQVTHGRIQVTGPNVCYVEGGIPASTRFIRAIVENDREFANITLPALQALGQLCVYATKAYIWNECIISMSRAPIIHGVEYERIASIIEGYEEAIELYENYKREKWVKINNMQDPKAKFRMIRLMMPT